MTNRFPGNCTTCNARVEAEAGTCYRNGGGRFVVKHDTPADCQAACQVAQAIASTPRPTRRPSYPEVAAGHYAVESRTGTNDLDFFRVDRPSEGKWEGYTFVKRVIGGHPDTPVRGPEARTALERIAADPSAAATRYGVEIGRCYRCNRHLTDETSRTLGIGPECRKGN